MQPTRESQSRRKMIGLAGGSGAAAFAALAVLLLVPAAIAGGPTVIKAPFTKATVILSNPASHSGCGSNSVLNMASFNKTTGFGYFSDNATSSWCTNATNNSGVAQGFLVVHLPIKAKTNGTHTITAYWITIASGFLNLSAGKCAPVAGAIYPACSRSAEAFVYGSAFVLDKTTHKKVKPLVPWAGDFVYSSNYTSCYLGSCSSSTSGKPSMSFSGNFPWVWNWNMSMLTTDRYVLEMTVFGGAQVHLSVQQATLSGASGNAQLNSATLGNSEQLVSVTVN